MTLHQRVASHLRSGQVSRVIYGSIIGLALVLALEVHPPRVLVVVGALLATAVAVALAELYSEVVGGRARAAMGGPELPMRAISTDAAAVAFGIAFPGMFFAAAALDLLDYDSAFRLAKWTGLGLIAGYGYAAGRLSGSNRWAAVLEAASVAFIALVLIVLKSFLH